MPIYVWRNDDTNETKETFREIKDMDTPPDGVDLGEEQGWYRSMQSPAVPRASFVDGIRKDLNGVKRIAQLRIDKAGKRDAEQAEISKEIKTLERRDAEGKN
tara:strand:+ start:64 stop:369 length:306 start_codon:yes stop_codon:yes gene_type:complete